ncbi:hypothetical protein PoB_001116100 [Plakobranchus ocellatus]|uniref:Uncharacterized protein n=1 Tax=Plakobranchus ocellatus TaxID=259542 RepID=A0AAV3YQF6_9GAST|nr:hypothetical protein PoB_001116100 [Plakobranchus ocellatus]
MSSVLNSYVTIFLGLGVNRFTTAVSALTAIIIDEFSVQKHLLYLQSTFLNQKQAASSFMEIKTHACLFFMPASSSSSSSSSSSNNNNNNNNKPPYHILCLSKQVNNMNESDSNMKNINLEYLLFNRCPLGYL